MNDPLQRAAPPAGRGSRNLQRAADRRDNRTAPDLFSTLGDEGLRRRDDGMRTTEHAAHPGVRVAIDQAISEFAATGEPFTSDDVRTKAQPFGSPNLLGARINAAARRGEIVRVGFVQTVRPEAHGRHVSQWQGVRDG